MAGRRKRYSSAKKLEAVRRARLWLHEHYPENPGLTDVARAVRLSPCYFRRIFRAVVGHTPREYTDALRAEHARRHGKAP